MSIELVCPRCGGDVVKCGKHHRKGGLRQRYCCKKCGHVFIPKEENKQ